MREDTIDKFTTIDLLLNGDEINPRNVPRDDIIKVEYHKPTIFFNLFILT